MGGASPSTTTYLNALGASSEKFVAGASTTWRDYIQADGHIVAERFSGASTAMRYFVLDHLGSVAVITDETGAVTERLSYDAWGQRRCANGTGNASCFTASATTRGFTNQEEIDSVGLVNLNARIGVYPRARAGRGSRGTPCWAGSCRPIPRWKPPTSRRI